MKKKEDTKMGMKLRRTRNEPRVALLEMIQCDQWPIL